MLDLQVGVLINSDNDTIGAWDRNTMLQHPLCLCPDCRPGALLVLSLLHQLLQLLRPRFGFPYEPTDQLRGYPEPLCDFLLLHMLLDVEPHDFRPDFRRQ